MGSTNSDLEGLTQQESLVEGSVIETTNQPRIRSCNAVVLVVALLLAGCTVGLVGCTRTPFAKGGVVRLSTSYQVLGPGGGCQDAHGKKFPERYGDFGYPNGIGGTYAEARAICV